jgi:hypothetical protein
VWIETESLFEKNKSTAVSSWLCATSNFDTFVITSQQISLQMTFLQVKTGTVTINLKIDVDK